MKGSMDDTNMPTVFQLHGNDGKLYWVEVIGKTIYDDKGIPTSQIGIIRNITDRKRVEEEKERILVELQESLVKVKKLSGLLPICANCKSIRDDKGYWNQVEDYIQHHSEAQFSHGLCDVCVEMLYGKEKLTRIIQKREGKKKKIKK